MNIKRDKNVRQVEDLDERILSLILERASLFAEVLKKRRLSGNSFSSGDLEGEMWKGWYRRIKDKRVNSRILRNIYNHINHLSYDIAEREEEREFVLSPRRKAVSIDIAGPCDRLLTRFILYLSAALDLSISLKKVVLNDPLYEMLKVLNSVGASFKWEKDTVERDRGSQMEFDRHALFVGGDLLNLYLLLFYALSRPCICKFTGEARLRTQDLRPLFDLLPQLGARIVPFIPGSYGLPVRLEATGTISDEIVIGGDAPEEMVVAFLLSAPVFSRPLYLKIHSWPSPFLLERVLWTYEMFQIEYERDEEGIRVCSSASPDIDSSLNLPVDVELCSYLLAFPLLLGGKADIRGMLSGRFPDEEIFLGVLSSFGVVTQKEGGITSQPGEQKKIPTILDVKGMDTAVPLSCGLLFSRARGKVSLANVPASAIDEVREVCGALGIDVEKRNEMVTFRGLPLKRAKEVSLYSPCARWSLALSLLATSGIDIVLANPGEITAIWPSYWPLYRMLPEIRDGMEKREEMRDGGRKRRRILVAGNKKIGERDS